MLWHARVGMGVIMGAVLLRTKLKQVVLQR